MTSADQPHFAVLQPDGQITYGYRLDGDSTYRAVRAYISGPASQGTGRLRAWYSDSFTADMPPNPLADRVLSAIGYHHPSGWRGTVALSMEEDNSGECPPLTVEVQATLDELAQHPAGG